MAASDLEFRVLGAVEAARDGVNLRLGGRRQRMLLALLILEDGQAVATDRLIDELWSDAPPAGASTLPSYVSRLRTALGSPPTIENVASGYRLAASPGQIDARRFEQLVSEGRAALSAGKARRAGDRLRAALALWRGRPFGELGDDGALHVEAERLEELRLLALEHRIEADVALGSDAGLIDDLDPDFTGQSTLLAPGVLSVAESATITGGTGRFAGATGSFAAERMFFAAQGVTTGSFEGTISSVGQG